METIIHYITHIPTESWYHLAAFVLTGAGVQYTIQLIKIIGKCRFGKSFLRVLNGAFSALYVAAGAVLTGGISLGNYAKTSAALATLSVLIYRIHNSFLYKSASDLVSDELSWVSVAEPVPQPQFTEN